MDRPLRRSSLACLLLLLVAAAPAGAADIPPEDPPPAKKSGCSITDEAPALALACVIAGAFAARRRGRHG